MKIQNKFAMILTLTIALLSITTGFVFASGVQQGPPPFGAEGNEDVDGDGYFGPMHGGIWAQKPRGEFPPMRSALIEAVADATGLTVADLEARIEAGETLYEVALSAGMSEDAYLELRTAVREANLAEALEAGLITEERYQWMLERMEARGLENGFVGRCLSPDGEFSPRFDG